MPDPQTTGSWLDGTDAPPSEAGWYPTSHQWDAGEEPSFGAHWWDGAVWRWGPDDKAPPVHIDYLPTRCASLVEADRIANEAGHG